MSLENVLEHFKCKTFFLVKNIYSEIDVKKCQILSQTAGKWYCARSACSSIAHTQVLVRAVACIISYQCAEETTSMQCHRFVISLVMK